MNAIYVQRTPSTPGGNPTAGYLDEDGETLHGCQTGHRILSLSSVDAANHFIDLSGWTNSTSVLPGETTAFACTHWADHARSLQAAPSVSR